jgi:2,3-bisphosphoglycerate-dependent phosphoglycerate mutase
MSKLILIRHGQSIWNLENRFTGWVDVPLTKRGESEARIAAELIKNISVDVAYTSMLQRASSTLNIIMDTLWLHIPIIRDQSLNERFYGDLQGLNKDDARREFGEDQVKIWRRSFDIAPPKGESLKDTAARTLPFFKRCVMGDIRQGKDVLLVAHGNSIRSIIMDLDNLSKDEVLSLELETGVPVVYDFDKDMKVLKKDVLHHP